MEGKNSIFEGLTEKQIDEIYSKIKANTTKENFLKKLEEILEHFGDTITKETALHLAAYGFGFLPRIKIAEIGKFRGEVSLIGRVTQANVREFKKKGEGGLIAKLTIADETGETTVVLWNDAAKLVKIGDIFPGCELEIRGFIRKNGEEIEISVNDAAQVNILGQDEVVVEGYFIAAQEISGGMKVVIVGDKLQTLPFAEGVEKLNTLNFGDHVKLRFFSSELLEVEITGKKLQADKYFTKLSEILEAAEIHGVNVVGRVSGIGMLRKLVRGDRTIRYAEIFISDDSARVRVLLWGENSSAFRKIDVGSRVIILNGRVKDCEIHCGTNTIVLV